MVGIDVGIPESSMLGLPVSICEGNGEGRVDNAGVGTFDIIELSDTSEG